jgi:ComF family protein
MQIIRLFFSVRCFNCGIEISPDGKTELICPKCVSGLKTLEQTDGVKCRVCRNLLYESDTDICRRCSKREFPFDTNYSIFYYREYAIRELVHKMKFESNKLAARDLALILQPHIKKIIDKINPDIITPVPLSKGGLRKRGFNQVELILNKIGVKFDRILFRKEHAHKQSELNASQRMLLIKGQFSIKGEASIIRGKSVLVVDDVFTTGATSAECSRILIEAGADCVNILSFFRD